MQKKDNKDAFIEWLDKYIHTEQDQVKKLNNNFTGYINDTISINYTGAVQPIASEDYNHLIDEYIQQLKEFLVIDFKDYNSNDFNNVIQIFNSQYLIMYIHQIRTQAQDLYIKDIREQHTLKVLNTLADLQHLEIRKLTDKQDATGYYNFIYTDLEELKSKYNLTCHIEPSALLQVQQDLKRDAENLSESERQKFLAGDKLKLTDSDNTYTIYMLFKILVMEYQKPFTESLIDRDFKDKKEYYKTRHNKLQQIDKLIKECIAKLEQTKKLIEVKETEQALKDIANKTDTKIKRAIIRNKIPNVQIIQLDLMKFFNNQYIINQLKAIDENAYKKDLRIEAMLLFDQDDKDLANVRFSHLILKEQDQERVQLHPLYNALLSGFIDIRDANGDTDKSVKLQDALRLISNDSKYRLPKDKKSLKAYEDIMLFAKKCTATFQIIDNTTGELILDLQDPIPLLENYKIFNGVSKEYEYIIGNSFIRAFKNQLERIYNIDNKQLNQTSNTISKGYLKDGQRVTPAILDLKYYIYPKIMQMINSVNNKQVVNPIINIEPIYQFYADFRGHTEPTDDDRREAKQSIEIFLEHLRTKQLIKSYARVQKTGKVTSYKISVYSNRDKRELKDKN